MARAHRAWRDKRLWLRIRQNGLRRDYSWTRAARDYASL